jgi:1-acyl-sn-glycerol-3-phosphate acyltransferase
LRKPYYTDMTAFRRVATPLVLGVFHLFANVRIFGAEKMPASGPVVLVANHLTNFDVLPLQMAATRPIFYMGKEELFRNPLMDWVFRQMGSFPVYRGAGDDWAMAHAEKVLAQGQVLGIFPEGRRSRGKGLASAKTGAARLALLAGCPIIPVGIHGPQYMFRRYTKRTPVEICLGDPIYARPGERPLSLTDRMMFALAALLPIEQRGVYAFHPKGF